MRLNKFIAEATGVSRRQADELISSGRVRLANQTATIGDRADDRPIFLDDKELHLPAKYTLIAFNKPVGYVSSRRAQAKNVRTIYELLPSDFKNLKTVGRLDQNSSGLILLTDDGDFAFRMTHPKFAKVKVYEVRLDRPLEPLHQQMIADFGIDLEDGKSKLGLENIDDRRISWRVTMQEGRNRQIRRTFRALGYEVVQLHRTNFGKFSISGLESGHWKNISNLL